MSGLPAVIVALAVGAVAVAPGMAFAQFERRSPGTVSPGSPGMEQGVTTPDTDQPVFRGGPAPAPPAQRAPSPRTSQPPVLKGGPEPAPPLGQPPAVTTPAPLRRAPTPSAPPPTFKGGPEPLPPGQHPPSLTPPPSRWTPPPSDGGLRRRPMPPGTPRQPPEIRPGWPLRRPLYPVIVRRRYDHDRYRIYPRIFLPPVLFGAYFGVEYRDYPTRYDRNRLSWSDSEWIYREEGWVEFVLDVDTWGDMLWLEVRDGRARIDWAEIVFANGESQLVDFGDRSLSPGLYRLLHYRGERRVDHVRVVAMATTREVQFILRMER